MAVPYTFGTATAAIPLSQLDSNFATTITLGNTAIQLGNTVTTLNNMTLANVTVSSGSVTLTNIAVTTANVTTANIGTAVITGTSTLTGLTASTALALDASKNIVSVTNTGSGNNVLGTSPTIATPTINTITSAASTALTLQSNNGNTAVTIDTSQNVGIGTASPSYKLQVVGASNSIATQIQPQGALPDNTDNAGLYVLHQGTAGAGFRVRTDNALTGSQFAHIMVNNASASINGFQVSQYGTGWIADFNKSGTTALRIDSSGRVLINKQSTDGGQLNVQNSSTTTRAYVNATLRNSRSASTHYSVVSWNGSLTADAWIGQVPNTDALCFGFDAGSTIVESMRIDTSGHVLINATSTGSFSAAAKLSALGVAGEFAAVFRAPDANSYIILSCDNSNGQVGKIQTSGSATSFLTSSDYRLKENIAPMTGALAKVAALKPVTYKWKVDGTDGQGFIAHELAEVVPDCVGGEKDAVDADGNPIYQGVDTSFLVATLTAAIQEQQAIITSLTARIAALEAK